MGLPRGYAARNDDETAFLSLRGAQRRSNLLHENGVVTVPVPCRGLPRGYAARNDDETAFLSLRGAQRRSNLLHEDGVVTVLVPCRGLPRGYAARNDGLVRRLFLSVEYNHRHNRYNIFHSATAAEVVYGFGEPLNERTYRFRAAHVLSELVRYVARV